MKKIILTSILVANVLLLIFLVYLNYGRKDNDILKYEELKIKAKEAVAKLNSNENSNSENKKSNSEVTEFNDTRLFPEPVKPKPVVIVPEVKKEEPKPEIKVEEPKKEEVKKKEIKPPQFQIVGTSMKEGNNRVILSSKGKTFILKEGDELEGYKIKNITKDNMVYIFDNDEITVPINKQDGAKW